MSSMFSERSRGPSSFNREVADYMRAHPGARLGQASHAVSKARGGPVKKAKKGGRKRK